MKILLLGSSGYVGKKFAEFFTNKQIRYYPVSIRYPYSKSAIRDAILNNKITHVVNCAGYTGKPNVDSCEDEKDECLFANAYLPKVLHEVCAAYKIKLVHISSGCIYNDMNCEQGLPPIIEYPEHFKPNFSFDEGGCSWYSGTKALGEHLLRSSHLLPDALICRLRIPFNGELSPRNYVSKIANYPKLLNATNSFSQIDEFVAGCYHLMSSGFDSGTYNLTQPGYMTTVDVVDLLQKYYIVKEKEYFNTITEFNSMVKAPRSNCVLDSSSAIRVGVKLTHIRESMEEAVKQYANNIKQL